jgi:hypothetical protein
MTHEDGNAIIEEALGTLLRDRKNERWEIWDFVDRVLVAEYESETEAKSEIVRLAGLADRVRYVMVSPHNLVALVAYRDGRGGSQ